MGERRGERLHRPSPAGTALQPQPGTLPRVAPSPQKVPGASFPYPQGSPRPCKPGSKGRGDGCCEVGATSKEAQSLPRLPLPPERKKRDPAEFTPSS